MRIKMKIQDYLQQRDDIIVYIKQYQQKKYILSYVYYILLFLFALFILNTLVGGVLFFLNLSNSWYGHSILYFVSFLYILVGVFCVLAVEWIQYQKFKKQQAVLPLYVDAQLIKKENFSSAEEISIEQLNQEIADFFQIETLPIYLITNTTYTNIMSYQWRNQISILLTWQAIQKLSQQELFILLYSQYCAILMGETKTRSRIYHLLFAFNGVVSLLLVKSKNIIKSKKVIKILQKVIYSLVYVDDILQFYFKRSLYYSSCYDYDAIYIKNLKQPMVYISLLQKIHYLNNGCIDREYQATNIQLDMLYFAESRMRKKQFIYPTMFERLNQLIVKYKNNDPMLKMTYSARYDGLSYYVQLMKAKSLPEVYQQYELVKLDALPCKMLLHSQHSHLNRDAIRPLNPVLRQEQVQQQYITQIFPTQAHYLHSISLLLMLRKNPKLDVNDLDISATVCMALKSLDERLYIEVFQQCLSHINLPKIIAQEHLKQWFAIIQQNYEMSLIDTLLFAQLKFQCIQYMPSELYSRYEVIDDVIALFNSLTYIQPYQQHSATYKLKLFQLFIQDESITEYAFNPLDSRINYNQMLERLTGLVLQERLFLLYLVEQLLLEHGVLTQEGFDVLSLLYWRFGFCHQTFALQLYHRSQVTMLATML